MLDHFPINRKRFENMQLAGYHEAASRDCGDWWSYFQVGKKFFVLIGDATGHGIDASKAARAAHKTTIQLKKLKSLTVTAAMNRLNKEIFTATKGSIQMTFFIGCFDSESNSFTYCNASHIPPLLLRKKGSKDNTLSVLNANNAPRLGEGLKVKFKTTRLKLKSTDAIFLYTDGMTECRSPNDKVWGERNFIRAISQAERERPQADQILKAILLEAQTFRSQAPLLDDAALVVLKWS